MKPYRIILAIILIIGLTAFFSISSAKQASKKSPAKSKTTENKSLVDSKKEKKVEPLKMELVRKGNKLYLKLDQNISGLWLNKRRNGVKSLGKGNLIEVTPYLSRAKGGKLTFVVSDATGQEHTRGFPVSRYASLLKPEKPKSGEKEKSPKAVKEQPRKGVKQITPQPMVKQPAKTPIPKPDLKIEDLKYVDNSRLKKVGIKKSAEPYISFLIKNVGEGKIDRRDFNKIQLSVKIGGRSDLSYTKLRRLVKYKNIKNPGGMQRCIIPKRLDGRTRVEVEVNRNDAIDESCKKQLRKDNNRLIAMIAPVSTRYSLSKDRAVSTGTEKMKVAKSPTKTLGKLKSSALHEKPRSFIVDQKAGRLAKAKISEPVLKMLDRGITITSPTAGVYRHGHPILIRYRVSGEVSDDTHVTIHLRDKLNTDFDLLLDERRSGDAGTPIDISWTVPFIFPRGIDYYIHGQAGDLSGESDTFSIGTVVAAGSSGISILAPHEEEYVSPDRGGFYVIMAFEDEPGPPLSAIRLYRPGSLVTAKTWPPGEPPLSSGRVSVWLELPTDVPQGDDYWLRVNAGSGLYATSSKFSIRTGGWNITVDSPTSGDRWFKGETYDVHWQAEVDIGRPTVKIVRGWDESMHVVNTYSRESLITTRTAGGWHWSWTVPYSMDGAFIGIYRIKVESESGDMWGYSSPFSVDDTRINIHTHLDDTILYKTKDQLLTWTENISVGGNTDVLLWHSGCSDRCMVIAENVASHSHRDGHWNFSYRWVVGRVDSPHGGADCRIDALNFYKIRFKRSGPAGGMLGETGYFSIRNPTLVVTDPRDGEVLRMGETKRIRWTSDNLGGHVDIELFARSSGSWTVVDTTADRMNSRFIDWTPTERGDAFKARVRSVRCPSIYADSDIFSVGR